MERQGGRPSLHQLVLDAVARGADTQEVARAAVADTRAAVAALARTVAEVHSRRDRRGFVNRHLDDQDPRGAG